jgi:putative FmdB family regulatory protein
MPIYTYRCTNCGVRFDQQQKFSDAPLTRCPECNKKTLQKVFQPVGIVFKGSGFYSTDHRSPSGQQSRGHKHESDESGEKSAASTSESSAKSDSGPKPESGAKSESASKSESSSKESASKESSKKD